MQSAPRRESGFTLIEIMVVLTIISILSVIATVNLGNSSNRAYEAAMVSDLRNVATAQEAYIEQTFAETGTATYANDVRKLDMNLSNGVTIRMRGNGNGWSARATHERVRGIRCAGASANLHGFGAVSQHNCDIRKGFALFVDQRGVHQDCRNQQRREGPPQPAIQAHQRASNCGGQSYAGQKPCNPERNQRRDINGGGFEHH